VADETRQQAQETTAIPPADGDPGAGRDAGATPAASRATGRTTQVTPARADAEDAAASKRTTGRGDERTPWIRVGDRTAGDFSRTSPRMRLDLLQIGAWLVGLYLIISALVAVARAGFDDLGLFEPVVEVGGQPATPLWALLWLIIGAFLLSAATGSVAEQRLRIAGVVFAVVGLVFLIEPDAFTEYLGVTADSGSRLLVIGALLIATSFVPPLSIRRPGIREQ
jgi:hypothetical protein